MIHISYESKVMPKNINPLYIRFKLAPLITTEINSKLLYRICIPDCVCANIPVPNLFTLEISYKCSYHVLWYNEGTKRIEAFMRELQDSVLQFLIHSLENPYSLEKNGQNKHFIHGSKTILF